MWNITSGTKAKKAIGFVGLTFRLLCENRVEKITDEIMKLHTAISSTLATWSRGQTQKRNASSCESSLNVSLSQSNSGSIRQHD